MADTNKMLQFKMGEWTEGFDNITKSPGTVYITTNEKAMYVDVDNDTRIRIGDIIQVESARVAKPPFSTDALYYFIEENALLKWGDFGVDADGKPNGTKAWKQLNSVSDITTNLNNLTQRVTTVETSLTTLNKQVNGAGEGDTGLVGRIVTLEGKMDSAEGRLEATEGVANAAKDAIGDASKGLVRDVADLKAKDESLEGAIGDNADAIGLLNTTVNDETNGLVKKVATLEETTGDLREDLGAADATASTTTAFGRIAKLEGDLSATNENVDNVTDRVDTLEDNYDTLSQSVTTNANEITALKTQVGNGEGLTGRITTLETTMREEQGFIDTLQGQMSTAQTDISGLKTADENLQKSIDQNADDIKDVSGKVDTLEDTVGNASGGLVKDVADLKAEDTAIKNAATALTTRVTNVETKAADNATAIGNLQTTVGEHTDAISTLTGAETVENSVKYQIKQAKDALETEISQSIKAANAMNYIGSVEKWADLPTSDVHVGDTYVVAAGFTQNGETYYAGDLLVAVGTEDKTTGVITSGLAWNHVETGYIVEHEAHLSGESNQILLTSHTAAANTGDLGKITFEAKANTSATVEVAGNKVTIGMAWGSF